MPASELEVHEIVLRLLREGYAALTVAQVGALTTTGIADLAASGTRVRLVAGNHDDFLRSPLLQMLMQRSGFCELADEFLERLQKRAQAIRVADPFDPDVEMGALVNQAPIILFMATIGVTCRITA